MIKSCRVLKSIAAALCAALILLSPGVGAYQALAADFAAPAPAAGLPHGGLWAPRLEALTAPASAASLQGTVIRGVEVGALLRDLSGVDLRSAAGRLEASPVLERLVAAQAAQRGPLTQAQILEAVASAAAEQRASAAAVARRIEKGAGAEDSASVQAQLRAASRSWALLGEQARARVAAQAAVFARRVEAAKGAQAARTVKETIADWSARESNGAVPAGAASKASPVLSRFSPAGQAARDAAVQRPSASVSVLPQARQRSSTLAKDAAQTALVALPLVAAAAAAVLLPGFSPLLILTAGVVGSILLHETAHLFTLRRLGDDTAARHGVTGVNPLKLVDPLGTVALPIVSAIVSQLALGVPLVLGWAKPIPVDFNKLADPKKDSMKVALAGPAMNAALAAVALGLFVTLSPLHVIPAAAAGLLLTFAKINGALAAFNLIPLPQLDGGKVAVGLLPQKLYDKWTANKRLPTEYQSTFKKLYEGPSTLLNAVGMDGQGRINFVTRAITVGVFAAFAVAGYAWFGAPVALLMLVCSYDYYCIREKIQNEEATRSLMDLLQRFSSALAQEAENDDSIQSVVNTEEVEHILKNALEDTIDKVVDTEGFDELTPEQKMERFEAAYMDAAVEALHKKGMSADDPATIRRVLTKLGLGALAKGWVSKYDVWAKWHSPLRKKKKSLRDAVKQKGKERGAGGNMGMLALGLIGAGALAAHGLLPAAGGFAAAGLAMLAGTLKDAPRRQPSFVEALDDPNLKLTDKEKAFLQRMLKEMKLEHKAPVTGRTKELEQLLTAITSPRGVINSMAFVGKAGVGKTAVVELLAQLLAQSDAQDFGTFKLTRMNGRFLVKLNLARLLQQDDPAAALDALLEILSKFNSDDKRTGNKVILFVDEIHQMFDHPKGSQMANLLKEPLRDGELTIVAATTDAEYKKYMQNDEAFRRRMIPVYLDESSVAETIRALQGSKDYYEGLFGAKITPEALKAAAEMSKFDQEVFLPGRAFKYLLLAAAAANLEARRDALSMKISDKIGDLRYVMGRLAEELATKDRLTENVKENEPTTIELYNTAVKMTQELVALYRQRAAIPEEGTPVVTDELVKEEIARKTGVASGQLTLGSEPIEKYLEMEKILDQRVIGQEEAIATIAKAVRQNKAGLSDPKRPMGVFYLTGPTGSGKTHLAKELARFLFNDPDAVIRVDMTEYQESHAKSRMIGSPPGYVGYDAGGQLTEAVRKKPYSVILLDEIEKAHPDVFLLLLQIMGEGRLTDGQGRLVDFKNTMILMTSNLGMFAVDVEKYARAFKQLQDQKRQAALAGDQDTIKMLDIQMKKLAFDLSEETKKKSVAITEQAFKETYPPEFQGRLHAPPIVFNRITPESALKIAELNLRELRSVLGYAGHEIEWTPEVVEHVVNEGFSVALGARPLQNAIDRIITQPIATEILKAALANGQKVRPSRIKVSMDQGKLKIQVLPLEPKAPEKLSPGEGASREVFASAISAAAATAAGTATLPGIETIDEIVRAALAAYPDEGAPSVEAPAQDIGYATEKSSAPGASQPVAAGSPEAAAPAASPAQASPASSALFSPATPLTFTPSQTFTAAHYDNERKDANVKAAAAAIAGAMDAHDYTLEEKAAALRTIEQPEDPHVGFLKLFVEQAKRMTPAEERTRPVTVAYEAGEGSLKLVVARPGTLGEAERKVLRNHFTGPLPASAAASRDKAEAMNAFMNEDGRRLMFDLYRKLSDIPGARLGWAQTPDGVQYWLELPRPAPERAAPPDDQQPPEERQPPSEAPASGAQRQGTAAALDASKTGFADQGLLLQHNALNESLQRLAYTRDSRIVASAFIRAAADKLKTLADTEGLSLDWSADVERAVITLRRTRPFSEDERQAILALFNENLELAHGIADVWAELKVEAGKVELELPQTRAVSQGDGFAGSTEGAAEAAPSAELAAKLAKLSAVPSAGAPHTVWITFQGARFETQIKPLLAALGLTYKERRESGASCRVKAWLPNLGTANQALTALVEEASVTAVTVDPELLPSLRAALSAPPADSGAGALAKLQRGPDGALDDRTLWVSFEAADASQIDGVVARSGGAPRERAANGRFARVKLAFATPAKAASAALALGAQDLVRAVTAHEETLARARALDKLSQRIDERDASPLSIAVTIPAGVAPEAVEALLGGDLKIVETPHAARPTTILKAAFGTIAELERMIARLGERADVEKLVVGADAYRILTEGVVTPVSRPDAGLKGLGRELALRLIEQGDQRSTSVRVAATDLLAAASFPEDLELARDWIRFDTTLTHRWPELAAAAMVLARHGSRADDEARLLRAAGYLSFGGYTADTYKPAKRRVAESLAKVWATDNPAKLRQMLERFEEEKAKSSAGYSSRADEANFHRYKNDVILEALYLALCKHAGPEAMSVLAAGWDQRRTPAFFDYLKRVDPARLRALVERWRAGGPRPDGADRLLTLYAVAEYGTREDAKRFFDEVSGGLGGSLDNQTTPVAAEAAARLVARAGAWDLVKEDARRALRESMGNSGGFARMLTAVQTAGEAGEAQDLDRLEELLRSDPANVNFVHEMTQHDAAVAWARLLHRLGLVERYLTLARPGPAGQPSLPILQSMLADVNPIVNEAALEALRLRLTERGPRGPAGASPAPAGPPAAGAAARVPGFYREGAPELPAGASSTYYFPDDASLDAQRPELARLSADQRAAATDWTRRFSRILQELLNLPFMPEVRVAPRPDGGTTFVWVLRQAVTRPVEAALLPKLGELVGLLLFLRDQGEETRVAHLNRLAEIGYDDPSGLFALIRRLAGDAAVAMGLLHDPRLAHTAGRGETELWLKLELPPPASQGSGFVHPHAVMFDPLRPHGRRGPDLDW